VKRDQLTTAPQPAVRHTAGLRQRDGACKVQVADLAATQEGDRGGQLFGQPLDGERLMTLR
jgi:hypothetical protein